MEQRRFVVHQHGERNKQSSVCLNVSDPNVSMVSLVYMTPDEARHLARRLDQVATETDTSNHNRSQQPKGPSVTSD